MRRLGTVRHLGALLLERRNVLGLQQGEVARRAGVSASWLSRLETEATTTELSRVLLVLDVLGLELRVAEAAERPQGEDDLLELVRSLGSDHGG